MNCERAQEQFSGLQEGNLPASLRVTTENHLKECGSCREAYSEFSRTWELLGSFDAVEPPAELNDRIMQRIDAHEWAVERMRPAGWRVWFNRVLAVGGVASMAALAVMVAAPGLRPNNGAVTGGVGLLGRSQPAPEPTTAGAPTLRDPGGESPGLVSFRANQPTRFTVYWTDTARMLNPDEGHAKLNGQLTERSSFEMPIGLDGAATTRPNVWFVWENNGREQITLMLSAVENKGGDQSRLTPFRSSLSEALRQIADAYGVSIVVTDLRDNPQVIVNDYSTNAETAIEAVLRGTNYRIDTGNRRVIQVHYQP